MIILLILLIFSNLNSAQAQGQVQAQIQNQPSLKKRLKVHKDLKIWALSLGNEQIMAIKLDHYLFNRTLYKISENYTPHHSLHRSAIPSQVREENQEYLQKGSHDSTLLYYPGAGSDVARAFSLTGPDEVVVVDPAPWGVAMDSNGEFIVGDIENIKDDNEFIQNFIRGYSTIIRKMGGTELSVTEIPFPDFQQKKMVPYFPEERQRKINELMHMDYNLEEASNIVDEHLKSNTFPRREKGALFTFHYQGQPRKMYFLPRYIGDEYYDNSPLTHGADMVMIRRTHGNNYPQYLYDHVLKKRGIFLDFSPSFSFNQIDRKDIRGPIWQGLAAFIKFNIENTNVEDGALIVKKSPQGPFSQLDNIFALVDFQQNLVADPSYDFPQALEKIETLFKNSKFSAEYVESHDDNDAQEKFLSLLKFLVTQHIPEDFNISLKRYQDVQSLLNDQEKRPIKEKWQALLMNVDKFIQYLGIKYSLIFSEEELKELRQVISKVQQEFSLPNSLAIGSSLTSALTFPSLIQQEFCPNL